MIFRQNLTGAPGNTNAPPASTNNLTAPEINLPPRADTNYPPGMLDVPPRGGGGGGRVF
jgi:hypothetical protein